MAQFPVALCQDCIFYFADGDGQMKCRRYPPIVIGNGSSVSTQWPEPKPHDTCGEAVQKK